LRSTLTPRYAGSSLPRRERGLAVESFDVVVLLNLRFLLGRELADLGSD